MNKKIFFSHFIVQQHSWRKYSLQEVPNQTGKSMKFQGVRGLTSIPGIYNKSALRRVGMDIFWNYTISIYC